MPAPKSLLIVHDGGSAIAARVNAANGRRRAVRVLGAYRLSS
ncbi:hypothetical protein A20C1_00310 [marine actinobacterium PHSC20C1]|nr:hypothetical protein A20C1_00310 [marine actinobacterium PHSC20C1]